MRRFSPPAKPWVAKLKFDVEQKRFLGQSYRSFLFWPAICAVAAVVLLVVFLSLLHASRQKLEAEALEEASRLAETYAQQISKTIGELNHVTALLKHYWEHAGPALSLDDLRQSSRFIDPEVTGVSIADREGRLVTTTLKGGTGLSIADRRYFKFHKYIRSDELFIGPPVAGRLGDREIATFSRRLTDRQGEFNGVVVASAGTPFLGSFANKSILGDTGLLALITNEGIIEAAKVGDTVESLITPKIVTRPVLNFRPAYIGISSPDWFADGVVRYIASKPVPGYPLHAVVGLGQDRVLAPLEQAKRSCFWTYLASLAALLLFSIVAFFMSFHLAWRVRQEESVRRAYRVATEGANEGFYMWRPVYGDQDGEIVDYELVDCNERGAELFGQSRAALLGGRLKTLYSSDALSHLLTLVPKIRESGFYEDEAKSLRGGIAQPVWLYRRFVSIENGIAVTLRDISDRKRLEQERVTLAEQDSLTKLPNRRWLMEYLPTALANARAENGNLALLFIDLDGFKVVNDSWGHSTGDKLLHAVAGRMRAALRPNDKVARFGGDEFVVVLGGIGSEKDPAEVAQRICELLEEPFQIDQHECLIGATVGISLFPRDGADAETLIRNADISMYSAKSEAKGRFRFFDQQVFARLQNSRELERDLVQAIDKDQFVVHYQPRVDARSGDLVGMEALVRWQHPARGLIYPGGFISLAENSKLILRIGEIIVDKVCLQLHLWRRAGLPVVPVSVNASARQFDEGRVKALITEATARHELPASLVEVELTESTMVNNSVQVSAELEALHAIGVSVHLDDFGTGYSSLSVLHKLDVDVLKIDRSFTSRIGMDGEAEILFKAIISMAEALGMRVVAEGVETEAQLEVLRRLGCTEIQGFLVSKALPAEEVERFFGVSAFSLAARPNEETVAP